jgi:hypothetical protein
MMISYENMILNKSMLVLDKYVQAINKCDEYVMRQKACLAKLF